MRRLSLSAVMLLMLAALSACNTMQGLGKDIEDLGRAIGL